MDKIDEVHAFVKNDFCQVDEKDYPKWTVFNAISWKLSQKVFGDDEKLWSYKRAWVSYNTDRILNTAKENSLPADFLGCVIFNELGGDPPWVKRDIVLPYRQLPSWSPMWKPPLQTSEGAIKIQLQVALNAIGSDDSRPLTWKEQVDLTVCLETDAYNIKVVAKYLVRMIKLDYPNVDTTKLTDEQFMVSGSRYNRGPARALKDYQDSLRAPPGTANRAYTSYGRAMMRHRAEVRALLGIN